VTDDVVDYNCIIPSLVTDGKHALSTGRLAVPVTKAHPL
jgi:hypothetical protein